MYYFCDRKWLDNIHIYHISIRILQLVHQKICR